MKDRSLNILFVIHTPKSRYTAVYNCYRQLADSLERHGHRATIVAPEDFPGMYRTHARWLPLIYPIWVAAWMARIARHYQLAVFHSYSGWFVQLLRRCVPAFRPLRLVTSFHGLEPMYYAELREEAQRSNRPLRFRFRLLHGVIMPWLIRLGCRRSDRITCLNSQETAYLERHRWGRNGTITLVANGVPREFFVERCYAPEARRLLFVGQWLDRKGTQYLVEAFTALARQLPGLELRCVGTLAEEQTVLSSFPVELQHRVSVRSQVSREELVSEYQRADIFVFPSLMEGFSISLLEAMAGGLPIVTTSVGAAPDILESEVSALLVAARDTQALVRSVQRLTDDRSLREHLGRQAQASAARFELESVHNRLESLFKEMVLGN